MANIKKTIFAAAEAAGYEGAATGGILGAIDALADTLAGDDVDAGTDIATAVGVLLANITSDDAPEVAGAEGGSTPEGGTTPEGSTTTEGGTTPEGGGGE